MTFHEELFRELRTHDRLGYVMIGDDITHPIWHVGSPIRERRQQILH